MTDIPTWEHLQARLYHLGWLGEELPGFVATTPPGGAWLYRQIAHEATTIARIATTYADLTGLSTTGQTTTTGHTDATPGGASRDRCPRRDGGGAA